MDKTPVMIVGVGRSGTSLLHSMLAAHSQFAFPPETAFIRRYIVRGKLTKLYIKQGTAECIKTLIDDNYFQRTKLQPEELVQQVQIKGPITDGAIYCVMLKEYARRDHKPRYGDKDPRSLEFLGLIPAVLGECHMVHVIRDPRDVLVSKKKAAWSSGYGVLRHIFANRIQLKIGRLKGLKLFGEKYHEVIYESLLADPEQELKKLCNELNVEFEHSMLDFAKSAQSLVSDSEMAWKKETLGPLLRDNTGKWRNELSDWETALIELMCQINFVVGGYKYSNRIERLSYVKRLTLYGVAILFMLVDPIYRLYRRWTVWRARNYA